MDATAVTGEEERADEVDIDEERAAEAFADLVFSDPDFVDVEFEEIIAGFWDAPRDILTPPHSPQSHWPLHGIRLRMALGNAPVPRQTAESTIRSPPQWDGIR